MQLAPRSCSVQQIAGARRRPSVCSTSRRPQFRQRAATADGADATPAGQVDLNAEVERFMKAQAELESGATFARTKDAEKVLGGEVISEEEAKSYARGVVEVLRILKESRDMTVNEARLVISIEDPRARERRGFDIEDERGVSRDEMAAALLEVAEGRLPKDRLALKCLFEEMKEWPYMDAASSAQPLGIAAAEADARAQYAALQGEDTVVKPYIMGQEARGDEKPQSLADMLPSWVGYLTLYGVSAIPVAIGSLVLLLLWNSQFH